MRLRTYALILVQIAGLIFTTAALAQSTGQDGEQGADYGSRDEVTRGTVLKMPRTSPTGTGDGAGVAASPARPVQTPPRGMTRSRVLAGYGEPQTRRTPVGQPPITRWDYSGYRLYFEYDRVLHAVVPNKPASIAHSDQLTRSTP